MWEGHTLFSQSLVDFSFVLSVLMWLEDKATEIKISSPAHRQGHAVPARIRARSYNTEKWWLQYTQESQTSLRNHHVALRHLFMALLYGIPTCATVSPASLPQTNPAAAPSQGSWKLSWQGFLQSSLQPDLRSYPNTMLAIAYCYPASALSMESAPLSSSFALENTTAQDCCLEDIHSGEVDTESLRF